MKQEISVFLLLFVSLNIMAQNNKDRAIFRESKPGFYQNYILRDDLEMKERKDQASATRSFAMDLSSASLPNKIELYKNKQWHNAPVSQGATSTCWSFSTTSFLETEVYRINKMNVKLSEMFTVYWEYVEKAGRYIRERGNSAFAEGSEANAVTRIWKKYGVVPYDSYTGLLDGRKFHNHEKMFGEMNNFLKSMKENSSWNEAEGIETIKSIMNHYIGVPPTAVIVGGKSYTPLQYLTEIIKINPDDYVDILSYIQEPFYKKVEYKVPDNWWHSADYYNVPLDVFMATLKSVVRKGYTISIGGDVSEPGFDRETQCAVIPDFDIPSAYINDDARQFRFSNRTTTDDHGMHLVGYLEKDGRDWYLIKDSGSGSRNNDLNAKEFGYYFFSEDYIKLKMMDFMVHKDAVKDLLLKF
ncbi:MAG TPA: C1 family peptidase [Bacteroidales bacterium]|nr:MAG: Peptidase C1-like family protein [Bacteroidetes bacterium ADurb.Bin145]HOU02477.1 C1 family peptidase [Bacteroidales bacterium]HQK68697.1 C1 family peptidase [Bacteroidales bacterium]